MKWMKSIIYLLCILVIVISMFTSCGEEETPITLLRQVELPKSATYDDKYAINEIEKNYQADSSLVNSINSFAIDVFQELQQSQENKSFVYSPVTLFYSLGLVASAGTEDIQNEFKNTLYLDDMRELPKDLRNLYPILYKDNEISKFRISNSLWVNRNLSVKNNFAKIATDSFYSSMYYADFQHKKLADEISSWISKNSFGTMSPYIYVPPEDDLSLINTASYYDEWVPYFDPDLTKMMPFHVNKGESLETEYIDSFSVPVEGYIQNTDDYISSSLKLKNGESMLFIIPKEDKTVADIINNQEKFQQAFSLEQGNLHKNVRWQIPKFSVGNTLIFKDKMKNLGITKSFEDGVNFPKITNESISLGEITQESRFSIHETGVDNRTYTKLAANKDLSSGEDSFVMFLNRPFIYAVVSDIGVVEFMGICQTPAVAED